METEGGSQLFEPQKREGCARENRGLEPQEAGAEMENATFKKPNPAKFFDFHLMPAQKENFPFVSLLRQRS